MSDPTAPFEGVRRRGRRTGWAMLCAGLTAAGLAACTVPGHPHPSSSRPATTEPTRTTKPTSTTKPTEPTISCRGVAFDDAGLAYGRPGNGPLLIVSGSVTAGTNVTLEPVTYIQQPEYWQINVIGCIRTDVFYPAVMVEYSATLPIAGTTGTKGVEVVGATKAQRIDVP